MPLVLILAETGLELIPDQIRNHPSVTKNLKVSDYSSQLLDNALHHSAMINLSNYEKRGRPDLVHISLHSILSTPLCKTGHLKIFLHTVNDLVIQVDPSIRLPRNYTRFVGLISQLFEIGQVPPNGFSLLSMRRRTMKQLLDEIKPKYTILFSETGQEVELMNFMCEAIDRIPLAVIVGGFPHGNFSEETYHCANETIAISKILLDAHVVVSRVIYAYEMAVKTKLAYDF